MTYVEGSHLYSTVFPLIKSLGELFGELWLLLFVNYFIFNIKNGKGLIFRLAETDVTKAWDVKQNVWKVHKKKK